MPTAAWCLFSALVAGILVYALQERRRAQLRREASELRTGCAVAQSKAQELERAALEQSKKLGAAEADRFSLGAELQATKAKLSGAEANERRVREDFERIERDRQALNRDLNQVQANHGALQKVCEGLREQLESQKAWIADQTKLFEQSVLTTATRVMDERGRAFTENNKKEVDAVVSPFKEQLAEFRKRIDEIYTTDTRERGQLHEQIVQLTSLNQAVSSQAERLTNALTITSKATGDWGETILQKILEDSGLREGKEYELQHSVQGGDGERLQPDAVIFLPENRQLVIDAKVSNKAWTLYCSATDEAVRDERFKEHLLSLRTHVKGLAAKDYSRSPDLKSVDFVLMFVPVEVALLTALAKDESLYAEAYRSKIILVTPSTLMAVVKLVEGIWTFQKRKESADEIAEAGRKLLEKLVTFAGTFVEIGAAISRAQDTFEKARGQLSTGKGNAIRLAQQMVELGVTPGAGKTMPASLLEADPGDDPH